MDGDSSTSHRLETLPDMESGGNLTNMANKTDLSNAKTKLPDKLLRIFATLRKECQLKMDTDPQSNVGKCTNLFII